MGEASRADIAPDKHIYKAILMSFFSRISSLFSRRSVQLTIVGVLAFFLLGPIGLRDHSIVYSGGVTTTWAAGEDAKKDKNATDEMVENMVAFLNIILGVITFLITPLVMLAGWLLSPDWTFGEIFGLRAVFHNIWILISNVVYVIFAFILVTIAFMNIFGGGHDHAYEIKKALPKLVVSILIVPFTWFIVSAVLSIANVLTASVIQLPVDMLGQTTNGNDILNTPMVPKNIVYNHGAEFNSGSYTVSR